MYDLETVGVSSIFKFTQSCSHDEDVTDFTFDGMFVYYNGCLRIVSLKSKV